MEAANNIQNQNLAKAMVAAFAEMQNVTKDAENPHFGSDYATLGAVLDTVRDVWGRHGLALTQAPGPIKDGNVTLTSIVSHASGETLVVNSEFPITPQKDKITAQGVGSAITYARRYVAAALAGIAQVDDDGNAASSPPPRTPRAAKAEKQQASGDAGEVLSKITAETDYERLTELESEVQATGSQDVINAYVAKRTELRRARKQMKEGK